MLIKRITVVDGHVPDVTTFSGLCDMMMLGNVCELGVLMQRRFYEGGNISEDDIEECRMARWRYRQFQTWFQSEHVLVVNGKCYEPMAAFRRSLVEFTAGVCRHKYKFNDKVPHHKNFTGSNLLQVFAKFLKLEYPEMLEAWKDVGRQRKGLVFYWNGPRFEVRLRSALGDKTGVLDEFEDDSNSVGDAPGGSSDGCEVEGPNSEARKVSDGGMKRKRATTPG